MGRDCYQSRRFFYYYFFLNTHLAKSPHPSPDMQVITYVLRPAEAAFPDVLGVWRLHFSPLSRDGKWATRTAKQPLPRKLGWVVWAVVL